MNTVRPGRSILRAAGVVMAVFLSTILLLTTACSKTNTSTTTTTTKATTTTTTVATTMTSARTTYPLTVTDLLGRSVQIAKKPASIVTVFPTATETVYRIGGVAVGRDSSSKYPPEAQSLPTVGSAYALNNEAIAALKPDLIVIEALTQGRLIGSIDKLGAPVVAVRAANLDDVTQSLTLMGKVLDLNDAAAKAAADIKGRIASVKKAPGKKVLIFTFDADRKVYAAKPESYPGTLATLLGLDNLAAGMPENAPYPGFSLFTSEQATTANPDAVFCISPAPAPAPTLSSMLPQIPGFNQMAAVKNGKVKELDPALFLQAQGPRIADAAEQLSQLLNQVAP